MKVPVAHDFTCPWCWVGIFQAKQMKEDFGAELEWLGYELWPDELDWPAPRPPAEPEKSSRPKTPTKMDLAYAAQQMEPPTAVRPKQMRTHNAHEAVEYAKTEGKADEFVEKLYRALWEDGQDINDPQVLAELAQGVLGNIPAMEKAIAERQFKDKIVGFDEPAYASGVYNVPTFIINGERYAEQPYSVLRRAFKQ